MLYFPKVLGEIVQSIPLFSYLIVDLGVYLSVWLLSFYESTCLPFFTDEGMRVQNWLVSLGFLTLVHPGYFFVI